MSLLLVAPRRDHDEVAQLPREWRLRPTVALAAISFDGSRGRAAVRRAPIPGDDNREIRSLPLEGVEAAQGAAANDDLRDRFCLRLRPRLPGPRFRLGRHALLLSAGSPALLRARSWCSKEKHDSMQICRLLSCVVISLFHTCAARPFLEHPLSRTV